MRIISRFHDYYDSVMKMGQDRELVYLRHEAIEELKQGPAFPICKATSHRTNYTSPLVQFNDYIIGFCGKIYGVVCARYWPFAAGKQIEAICFNIGDLDNYVQQNFKKKQVEEYFHPEKTSWKTHHWNYYCQRKFFLDFFAEVEKQHTAHETFFIEKTCPIFIFDHSVPKTFKKNACLKDLEFFRVIDPFQAFQQLQMYLGGLASPEKKIPEVSNADMIVAKGFDKWSFRKPPST